MQVVTRFRFAGRTLVLIALIAPIPGHCLLFTFQNPLDKDFF